MLAVASQRCPKCHAENEPSSASCRTCGSLLTPSATGQEPTAERKVVSVLFSDMAGFTALTETSDPEDVRQIMGDVYRCASEIVTRYGGRVEKFIGDAVMAIFGVPTSHEDDQIRAVRAAVELHEAVANLKHPVTVQAGLHLAMHSGVNTGVVVTGELHFGHGVAGPLGDTINTAARLMGAALTGEIWIGAETRRVVAPVFEVDDLGLQSFKGKANAVHASRVLRLRARSTAPSHQRGAFVGRRHSSRCC